MKNEDKILELVSEMHKKFDVLTSEIIGMKQEINGVKHEIHGMKQEILGIKDESARINLILKEFLYSSFTT